MCLDYQFIILYEKLNPYHAEFLTEWNSIIRLPFLALSIIILRVQGGNLNLVSQQYRAWSYCTGVHAGLALYWWQKLITFGVGRIRVKNYSVKHQRWSEYKNSIFCFIKFIKINISKSLLVTKKSCLQHRPTV